MKINFVFFLILIIGSESLMGQMNHSQDLNKWRERQQHLLQKEPQLAYIEAEKLEKKALETQDFQAELMAIHSKCAYYKINNDFDQMLNLAQTLLTKSKEYKLIAFEATARKHLFEALIFSGLLEKGYEELKEATLLARNLNDFDEFDLITKSDIYIANSNYHFLKKDYINQLKYVKISGKYFEKISNQSLKEKLLYIHNCNLAGSYLLLGKIDSATHYAQLSLSQEKNYDRVDIQFNNYSTLGNIALKKENYDEALDEFQKAENLEGYKNHLNTKQLYEKTIEIYHKKGDKIGVNHYKTKLDSLQLLITQNQNKSLHSLLKENEDKETSNYSFGYLVIIAVLALVLIWYLKKYRNRMNVMENDGKKEQKLTDQEFSKLFELIRKNDPAFMFYFDKKFQGFTQKLLKINPKLSSSELEVCALMMLNISTKKIAQYKFIAPKTVQNKKYLIRKKLKVTSDVDLYDWLKNV